jgi:hypothetical protein
MSATSCDTSCHIFSPSRGAAARGTFASTCSWACSYKQQVTVRTHVTCCEDMSAQLVLLYGVQACCIVLQGLDRSSMRHTAVTEYAGDARPSPAGHPAPQTSTASASHCCSHKLLLLSAPDLNRSDTADMTKQLGRHKNTFPTFCPSSTLATPGTLRAYCSSFSAVLRASFSPMMWSRGPTNPCSSWP